MNSISSIIENRYISSEDPEAIEKQSIANQIQAILSIIHYLQKEINVCNDHAKFIGSEYKNKYNEFSDKIMELIEKEEHKQQEIIDKIKDENEQLKETIKLLSDHMDQGDQQYKEKEIGYENEHSTILGQIYIIKRKYG